MKRTKLLNVVLIVATMALGHMAAPAMAEVAELDVVAPESEFPRVWRSYRTMDAEYSRTGLRRTPADIRALTIGSSRDDLVRALGQPVFEHRDGSLNFNISLPLTQQHRLICQYRVYFDDDARVMGTAWRRPQCADLVRPTN